MAAQAKARVVVAPNGTINVHVAPETLYDLAATQSLVTGILGRTGCPQCHSGRQIFFQQEEAEFNV